jgi:hypothetical protein
MSKKDEQKPEPSLVYKSLIDGIAKVRKYGIEKYGRSEDWRTTPSVKHFDAMLRHILAFMNGEWTDSASGLSHLYHAAANIMFEIERRDGPAAVRGEKICGDKKVAITCPRCKTREEYPLIGTWMCSGGCGYFIEPALELLLQASDQVDH